MRVNRVLIAPEVICRVVDADGLMVVNPVLREVDAAPIFRCEYILIALVCPSRTAAEYVILETWYEVLESMSIVVAR
jgi:hypothetical protein